MIGSVQLSVALHTHIQMHPLPERFAGVGTILLIMALFLVNIQA